MARTPLRSLDLRLPLSAQGRLRRLALFSVLGLSVAGVLSSGEAVADAAGAAIGSQAWLGARGGSARAAGGTPRANAGTGGLDVTRGIGSVTSIEQATARSQRSVANLARAAEAIAGARSAQSAAAALGSGAAVPNGLVAGGLQVAAGVGSDPSLWQNAELPTEVREGASTLVTVEQTDSRAILTWDSFNVGARTTLHIDQSAGTTTDNSNDWVALNRVTGSVDGAKIHGRIKAEGSVYVVDNNGILFGAGSTVNTHSLIASSLDLYDNDRTVADATFLDPNQGITAFVSQVPGNVLPPLLLVDPGSAAGNIRLEAGSRIETGRLGITLLAAPEIDHAGHIRVNEGQAMLLGARQVQLETDPGDDNRRAVRLRPFSGVLAGAPPETRVRNSGLIEATRGNVTLIARDVQQDGVIAVSSGIASPGSIVLTDGASGVDGELGGLGPGRVRFGNGAVTTILPDGSDETTTSSAGADASFQPGRIEVRAGTVEFGRGSLLVAPGATLDVLAEGTPDQAGALGVPGRVQIDGGAVIDLSGLAGVRPLAGSTLVNVSRVGLNELANAPVQRSGALFSQTDLLIDRRLRGVRADGTPWVGSPLLNADGIVDQVPRALEELLIDAGHFNVDGSQFISREGSQINLDGGWLQFDDASTGSSRIGYGDGHLAAIGMADPLRRVTTLAGRTVMIHRRWNVTSTYIDPLVGGHVARRLPRFIEGGNAGALTIALVTGGPGDGNGLVSLGGSLSAHAVAGREQVATGLLPHGGTLAIDTLAALAIRDQVDGLGADFTAGSAIESDLTPQDRDNRAYWTVLSGVQLAEAGLSTLALNAAQVVVEAGQGIALQAGSTIALSGARVEIGADLRTAGGDIRLTAAPQRSSTTGISFVAPDSTAAPATGDLVIGDGVRLSTRGRFVNDAFADPEAIHGPAHIDGGRISLRVQQSFDTPLLEGRRGGSGDDTPVFGAEVDTTGNIRLGLGSLLDASSGSYIGRDGRLAQRDLVPVGRGGDISLVTYPRISQQGAIGIETPVQAEVGRIVAAGGDLRDHLSAFGFEGGGTLELRALDFQIGGTVADGYEGLHLAADFFSDQGFAAYRLSSAWDATFAADTEVRVSHRNLLPDFTAILDAATGDDLLTSGAATVGRLDEVRRTATDLAIATGDFINANVFTRNNQPRDPSVTGTLLVDAGTRIVADAGADIRLGSQNQLTVLGHITARGGSITLSGDTSPVVGGSPVGLAPPEDPNAVVFATTSRSVWLGADSLLDVSGTVLLDPLAAQVGDAEGNRRALLDGRILDGGTVTLSNDSGHVIALEGARIEASGTAGRFELLEATGALTPNGRFTYVGREQNVWSDGGDIRVGAAGGLLFDATLRAAGGSAQARGGSFSITALDASPGSIRSPEDNPGEAEAVILSASARALILRQSGNFVPIGLLPGDDIEGGIAGNNGIFLPSGNLYFAVDRLSGSGIESLSLGQDPSVRPLSQDFTIGFAGNIELSVAGSLSLAAHRYRAIAPGALTITPFDPAATPVALGAAVVDLEAAHVSFGGYTYNGRRALDTTMQVNDAVLTVTGHRGLDLLGNTALQNFASATFSTDGDLRMYTPVGRNLSQDATRVVPGSLFTSGNLTLAAAQVYPASGNRFLLSAVGPEARTIRFEQTAAAPDRLPLSAGGSLLVNAAAIEQAGTLRAPNGLIRLGVADVADAATLALFGGLPVADANGGPVAGGGTLPLVATTDVRLEAGSQTSVSSAGLVVPYGVTVDGRDLQYDPVFGSQLPASASLLGAPPAKRVVIEGVNLDLQDGATVDLSGGGDLQAQEFVPGIGGTRDVLAAVGTVPGSAAQVNLFPDGREVYAILPGYTSAVGAYDPAIDSRGTGALVGQSVHLSGVGDLPEGDYILLPARYATLPGAWRVVQDTGSLDSIAALNTTLADGSQLSAGYFQDGYARLDGSTARDGRSSRFIVQRGEVWQQYSQYELNGANDYFRQLAADAGTATALRPLDAGQLVLAASGSIALDAGLNAAGGERTVVDAANVSSIERGAAAQVDIAARNIQIVGGDVAALDGLVQLSADDLNGIGAASLLIGGTRSQSAAGTVIDTVASRVVLTNTADTALRGSELILVASGTAPVIGEEPEAAVEIADGSVIATGSTAFTGSDRALILNGDGALLRLSNGNRVAVQRSGTGIDGGSGSLRIGSLASLGGGSTIGNGVLGAQSLTLDTSRSLSVAPDARFAARVVDANGSAIRFVADGVDTTGLDGLVLGSATLAQFAASESLNLISRDDIRFIGDVSLTLGETELSLSAGRFVGDGGAVRIDASRLSLGGSATATTATVPTEAGGSLDLNVAELVFGDGSARFDGFQTVNAAIDDRAIATGSSQFGFGAASVALSTPLLTANTEGDLRLTTTGALRIDTAAATDASVDGSIGGSIELQAASAAIDTRISARAGSLAVATTNGSLSLGSTGELDVAGVARPFFDVTRHASAGGIALDAAGGSIAIDNAAVLDFAAASGGGDAGTLSLRALDQTGAFTGTGVLRGSAADGFAGGRYSLDVGGAVALDDIAAALVAGGVDDRISIHSRAGNLELSAGNSLVARDIRLTADATAIGTDNGHIAIAGTLDASGDKGGRIALNGFSGVEVSGSLLATGASATERGGAVWIATGSVGSGLNAAFQYQNVTAGNAGSIGIADSALIDVSGGSAGGLDGGTVNFRSALLDSGDINLDLGAAATIRGVREVGVEAYAVWSTADGGPFDGRIDPAGNAGFYVGTLQGYLQQAPLAFETRLAGIENLRTRLGIELRNPSGDITVASNWNLGAAELDGNGNVVRFLYRHGNDAPVLTLRAAGNLNIEASISDGFVQLSNPLGLQAPRARSFEQVQALHALLVRAYPALADRIEAPASLASDGSASRDAQIAQYHGLYEQYLNYLLHGRLPVGSLGDRPITDRAPLTRIETLGIAPLGLGAPVAPANAQGYANYLVEYDAYLTRIEGSAFERRVALPSAPPATLAPLFTGAALAGAGGVDNSASPTASSANPLPLAAASLAGGASSSYRLIAGADFSSADLFAVQAADATGTITVSGSSRHDDPVTAATILQPTLIRTGTGSIEIAAARDFVLADAAAPGVIYTAGAPRAGTVADSGSAILQPGLYAGNPGDPVLPVTAGQSVVSGFVQPEAAGDLRLTVGGDIVGQQSAYTSGESAGQYWWSWLDTGNDVRLALDNAHNGANGLVAGGIAEVLGTSINFGSFGQGLLSVGGDVDISAGGDITRLSVSLPTTWHAAVDETGKATIATAGGGDLRVEAGGDLLGGSYFVAKGEGRLRADGDIGRSAGGIDTILAAQDGVLDVAARGAVSLAGVYNPAYLPASLPGPLFSANSQAYSARSSVSVQAGRGDLRFGTLSTAEANTMFGVGDTVLRLGEILPATVSLTALGGSIAIEKAASLFPSATGNLSLYADDAIRFASRTPIDLILDGVERRDDRYFGLIDADPANLPNALNQVTAVAPDFLPASLRFAYRYVSSTASTLLHARTALHGADFEPVRIYARNGDIVGGTVDASGILRDALVLAPDKQALVRAGRDIVNLSFQGQHVRNSDITRLQAGRDILDTVGGTDESVNGRNVFGSEPSLVLAGPGEFQLSAGRDLGPLANQNQIIDGRSRPADINNTVPRDVGSAPLTGINSIGNLFNPFLAREGAAITVLFGVGPGTATEAFIAAYIDPAAVDRPAGVRRYDAELVRFIQRYRQGLAVNTGFVRDAVPLPAALPADQAYAAFRALPDPVQASFVGEVFFDVLRTTGADFGNPDSPFFGQYLRGYQAVEDLFPAARGYTANNLAGDGGNGAPRDADGNPILVATGDLDLRGTTIQSQQGGTISIFGPGGEALLGSTSAPPFATDAQGRLFAGPGTQGLLSLEQGDIRIFTDRSLLLAQSRVFTEQGGDILVWSSNADINAGRGARTTAELPLPAYTCNLDFYCRVDNRGAVSGAGIATLQTIAGAEPGNIALIAPAGTVDLGDAGIRSSGNLVIAARTVANADNAQVSGSSVGLRLAAVDAGSLAAGSSAAAAAGQQATALGNRPVDRAATVITVEVYGFGAPDEEQKRRLQK
jgi:filamentous hemagglutinin family protein